MTCVTASKTATLHEAVVPLKLPAMFINTTVAQAPSAVKFEFAVAFEWNAGFLEEKIDELILLSANDFQIMSEMYHILYS